MKYCISLLFGVVALVGSTTLCADGELSADSPKEKHSHGHAHGSSDTPMKMSDGEGHHGSGSMGDHGPGAHWNAPPGPAARSNPVPADAASIQRGSGLYISSCTSCHGPTGRGDGPIAAALTPTPANLAVMAPMHPDGDLFWKIENGRGMMPAWKESLNEAQIWDLVNYLKSLKGDDEMDEASAHEHGSQKSSAGNDKMDATPSHEHGHQHGH